MSERLEQWMRYKGILFAVANGDSYAKAGEAYSISGSRARDIASKSIRQLYRAYNDPDLYQTEVALIRKNKDKIVEAMEMYVKTIDGY